MSSSRPDPPCPAAQRVYSVLKQDLLDQRLPAGQLITEGAVARRLFVSRTPVREALLRLEFEGLLRLMPKRGALVVVVSPQEVDEVFEARQLLEVHAARLALVGAETLAEELGVSIASMSLALRDSDGDRCVRLERQFHTIILQWAGNGLLSAQYSLLRDREERMPGERGPGWWAQVASEHEQLLRALLRGDDEAWMRRSREHVDAARRRLARVA